MSPDEKGLIVGRHIRPGVIDSCACSHAHLFLLDLAFQFSEWTSCLDLVEEALDENEHLYARIDGKMKAGSRGKSIR